MSLELAEKLNNYLNIYRIDKSSEPPACRGSKIRQMRSRPSKDAALWHKSGVQEICSLLVSRSPLWKNAVERKILFPQPIA
jgi:hypothetical protein